MRRNSLFAGLILIVSYLSYHVFVTELRLEPEHEPNISIPKTVVPQAEDLAKAGLLTKNADLAGDSQGLLNVREAPSLTESGGMTSRSATTILWSNGSPDRAAIEKVWAWLKAHPATPEYDSILHELLGTAPVEIAGQLITAYPSLNASQQQALIGSFGAMLDETSQEIEGDDVAVLLTERSRITDFLEATARAYGQNSAYAFEALLSGSDRPARVGEEPKQRALDVFRQLSPENSAVMFPSSMTGTAPQEYWAGKLAAYNISLREGQAKALAETLHQAKTLPSASQAAIARVLLEQIKDDAMLSNPHSDSPPADLNLFVLTPESRELLSRNKPWLDSIAR